MAVTETLEDAPERGESWVQLKRFAIKGLFGYLNHTIIFPEMKPNAAQPEILIVEGQNGTGKTTILKMIEGITKELNFDTFRRVPFQSAELELTTGDVLGVEFNSEDQDYPIIATFRDHRVSLVRERGKIGYRPEQQLEIDAYRAASLPLLNNIDFDLLTIDRALEVETKSSELFVDPATGEFRPRKPTRTLARKVREFLRDAQVNYRRFFQAEELELLPRILRGFSNLESDYDPDALLKRIAAVRARNEEITRFGLQTDDEELQTLADLLNNEDHVHDKHAISLLASYIEVHENKSKARDLIALRLSLFETIMDEFFVGKKIRISFRHGFEIEGRSGRLQERDLSSGEYHFLYMMVAALLCERAGTIIAIDEPELSLHVSWQRRLIGALSKCASGASPLFFLSTHSTAISSSYKYAVQTLSAID